MHAGQAMAHPLGTAFNEVVGIVDVGFGRYWLQGKVNVANFQRGIDPVYNDGTSLNEPDVEVPSPEGPVAFDLFNLDVNASYLINPNTNLRFVIGCSRRDLPRNVDNLQSTYIYVALRTSLFNRYYDI